ncbi:MAG: hypothetical protein IPP42_02995 [Saprospiraceae bacterium]|nr:hypothetical protein [Saprospiraceae bacterium]
MLFLTESGGHCSLRRVTDVYNQHPDIHHQDPEELFVSFLMYEYGITESGGHFHCVGSLMFTIRMLISIIGIKSFNPKDKLNNLYGLRTYAKLLILTFDKP